MALVLTMTLILNRYLCKIFNKSTRTIYRWFDRFKEKQIEKLADESGRGRKPALGNNDIEKVKRLIENNSIKETCIILNKEPNRVKSINSNLEKIFKKIQSIVSRELEIQYLKRKNG